MIYFLLIILPIIFIREYLIYKKDDTVFDPVIDFTEREITKNIDLIERYYVEHYIGERIKDREWMEKNAGGRQEVPVWRQFQILNTPETIEGSDFRIRMVSYATAYNDLKRTILDVTVLSSPRNIALNPNYLSELQKLNQDAQILFPKVFLPINRDKKLNELI